MKFQTRESEVKLTNDILEVLRFYKEENLTKKDTIVKMSWSPLFGYEVRKRIDYFQSDKDKCSEETKEIVSISLDLFERYMDTPEIFLDFYDYCRFTSTISPDFWHMDGLEYEDFC